MPTRGVGTDITVARRVVSRYVRCRAALAQSVRAPDCGSGGPPFEPGRRYQDPGSRSVSRMSPNQEWRQKRRRVLLWLDLCDEFSRVRLQGLSRVPSGVPGCIAQRTDVLAITHKLKLICVCSIPLRGFCRRPVKILRSTSDKCARRAPPLNSMTRTIGTVSVLSSIRGLQILTDQY